MLNFPNPDKTMDNLKNILVCLALVSCLACSSEEADVSEQTQADSSEFGAVQENFVFEPVVIAPGDKAIADKAPEGMVFIKGGCFILGNNFAQVDEAPEHEVCVDDFYLDKYEVTQARWEKVMGFNPSKFPAPDKPVEQITFYDVQEFAEESKGLCRIPTEAEWEYAARGYADARYFWGNMMNDEYAWYKDNSGGETHPVGQKKPNQFGVYDMMGNVWEWTSDWYDAAYPRGKQINPTGVPEGEFKVVRGGAFDSSAGGLRITNRTWLHPKNKVFPKVTTYGQAMNEIYNYVGFRCAMTIPTTSSKKTSPQADAE
jgi:formylglycine-generating enzyme required for sulfatase activity